ncbi:MAG: hypothetical protein OEM49_08175, partial [Myxococcales bacterium]|nr:hypothetical protein [Myxococcales bacterium]
PKCGADQREAPKQPPRVRAPLPDPQAKARRDARRMAPLLDEDEEEVVIDESDELELGLGVVDDDDDIIDEEEIEGEPVDEEP